MFQMFSYIFHIICRILASGKKNNLQILQAVNQMRYSIIVKAHDLSLSSIFCAMPNVAVSAITSTLVPSPSYASARMRPR